MIKPDLSRLVLGTWRFSGAYFGKDNASENIAVIQKAAEKGIKIFDSAYFYGQGMALKRLQKGLRSFNRKEMIFYGKGGLQWQGRRVLKQVNFEALKEDLFKTLEILKTDYLDVFFYHWAPESNLLSECLDQLEQIKATGLVRDIGFCNLDAAGYQQLRQLKKEIFFQHPHSILRPLSVEIKSTVNEEKLILHSLFEQGLLLSEKERQFGKKDVRRRHPFYQSSQLKAFQESRLEGNNARELLNAYQNQLLKAKFCIGPKNCQQLDQLLGYNF